MQLPLTDAPVVPQTHTALQTGVRRLILTGFMGAGKSTVGRMLAQQLGWEFVDLDALLEERAGISIAEIFARDGELRFRRLESSALASVLRRVNVIIALGGGAPESLTNRLLLEQTPGTSTVFLEAPFSMLFDRCMLQEIDRPNLKDPAAAQQRFDQRLPFYRRLAACTVNTSTQTPEDTVRELLAALA